MSKWREMLKEAKELFDDGLIDEKEYADLKRDALALRTQSTNPGTTGTGQNPARPPRHDSLIGTSGFETTGFRTGMGSTGGGLSIEDEFSQNTQFQAVGQTIGNYKVLGELDKGGMGTVYRARHSVEAFAQQTGDVVIKLMNPQFSQDPTFRQRFITEAATGRSIQHPNVVRIHDVIFEEHKNVLAIVMDLVEGRPLENIIPSAGMTMEQALPIIEQLSGALDHLHSTGIIHRDLKPENIIVSPDGKPVILDMGIAKNTEIDLKMTKTNRMMGTPLYMAPEQTDAKNVTSAADRYSFGLIVYQMLSARFPWDGSSGPGMITAYKMMGNLIPLKDVANVLECMSDAVMGLLRATASERWDTCADFMTAFVESEEDRANRLAAERAEQERLERERKAAEERARKIEEERQRQLELKAEQERLEKEKQRLTAEGTALHTQIETLLDDAPDEIRQEDGFVTLQTKLEDLRNPPIRLKRWIRKLETFQSEVPVKIQEITDARNQRIQAEQERLERERKAEEEKQRLTAEGTALHTQIEAVLDDALEEIRQEDGFVTLQTKLNALRNPPIRLKSWIRKLETFQSEVPVKIQEITDARNQRIQAEQERLERERKAEEERKQTELANLKERYETLLGSISKAIDQAFDPDDLTHFQSEVQAKIESADQQDLDGAISFLESGYFHLAQEFIRHSELDADRKEAERRRIREEQERIEREQYEAAKAFVDRYNASMMEIQSKRRALEAKYNADMEAARAPLIQAKHDLDVGYTEMIAQRENIKSKYLKNLSRAQQPLKDTRAELKRMIELGRQRAPLDQLLELKESELQSLEGFWSSLVNSREKAEIETEIAELRTKLSRFPSVDDLRSQIAMLNARIVTEQTAYENNSNQLLNEYNRLESQLNVDELHQFVAESENYFTRAMAELKSDFEVSLQDLITQEEQLKEECIGFKEEFASMKDKFPEFFMEVLDVVEFGVGDAKHEMVLIPKGEFVMGALVNDEDASREELPRHHVTLTRDFLMGKYPVTQSLWESVMGSNPSHFKGANRPVERVSWFDVVDFCNKLSKREGLTPAYTINGEDVTCNWTANGYRLPTEAEWEYGARANQSYRYSGSDNVDEVAWYKGNSGFGTHPVGQKKPNGFGLYDMSGNVSEWLWDWNGTYSSDSLTDPSGPEIGYQRVRRGGSWDLSATRPRVSRRFNGNPMGRDDGLGFRIVRKDPNIVGTSVDSTMSSAKPRLEFCVSSADIYEKAPLDDNQLPDSARNTSTAISFDKISNSEQIATQSFEEVLQSDLQLLETLTEQGNPDKLGEVCLRLGNAFLELKEWSQALQYFQKIRTYLPNHSDALKGIIECSWQQQEWSKVSHLCKLLVQEATTEYDVILGYLWRGFSLQTHFQKSELAEEHYCRVLEYDENNPVALLYLAGLAHQKGKWSSMAEQLQQGWPYAQQTEGLNVAYAIGRLLVAREQQDEWFIREVSDWFDVKGIVLDENHLSTRFEEVLQERFFGI